MKKFCLESIAFRMNIIQQSLQIIRYLLFLYSITVVTLWSGSIYCNYLSIIRLFACVICFLPCGARHSATQIAMKRGWNGKSFLSGHRLPGL